MKLTVLVSAPMIAVDLAHAAAIMGGLGHSTFLERVSRGQFPRPRKIGACSVWLVDELLALARELPTEVDPKP